MAAAAAAAAVAVWLQLAALLFCGGALASSLPRVAPAPGTFSTPLDANGATTALVWRADSSWLSATGEQLRIEAWGRDSLRVQASSRKLRDDLPQALLECPEQSSNRNATYVQPINNGMSITNGNLRAEVTDRGYITFYKVSTGQQLLAEYAHPYGHSPQSRHYEPLGEGKKFAISAEFAAHLGEKFFGLGQHMNDHLDQKGLHVPLTQLNTEVSIPFLFSSRGYGFLWNLPAFGYVSLGQDRTRWRAEVGHQVDYWVTTSSANATSWPASIMEHYVDATGHAPVLPEYASGFWQCKLRYRSQEQLESVVGEYKRRGLPLSVIVVDFFHWPQFGDWKLSPNCWPDPKAMTAKFEKQGVKVMVSVWPKVSMRSENWEAARDAGVFIETGNGFASVWGEDTYLLDPTLPEARQFIWQQVKRNYYDSGIKAWWLDADEPETIALQLDNQNWQYSTGSWKEVGLVYAREHARAFYEGMLAENDTDILSLSRSAYAGSQRYGAAVWSGDIESSFASLQRQVKAGLNIMMSGIPWWTTDIGGFYGGDVRDPMFQELVVRWFQYGAFCPLFRLHGDRAPGDDYSQTCGFSGGPNEVWSFGDTAYGIIKELLFLRERLRPYIMQQMRLASSKGVPPMRPLWFDFPNDPAAWVVEDQFMLGPDYMAAPVLEHGARERQVYLPRIGNVEPVVGGARWVHHYTNETYRGGEFVVVKAPLETFPLFYLDRKASPDTLATGVAAY